METTSKGDNEKKKEYLRRYQNALRSQKAIEQEIDQLRIDKMYPGALLQDGMPHGSTHSDLSSYVAKLDELMGELKEQLEEKLRIRQEITRKIDGVQDETESLLLRYRYIHGMKWEAIALEMGYSWKGIHKVHGRALQHLKI